MVGAWEQFIHVLSDVPNLAAPPLHTPAKRDGAPVGSGWVRRKKFKFSVWQFHFNCLHRCLSTRMCFHLCKALEYNLFYMQKVGLAAVKYNSRRNRISRWRRKLLRCRIVTLTHSCDLAKRGLDGAGWPWLQKSATLMTSSLARSKASGTWKWPWHMHQWV